MSGVNRSRPPPRTLLNSSSGGVAGIVKHRRCRAVESRRTAQPGRCREWSGGRFRTSGRSFPPNTVRPPHAVPSPAARKPIAKGLAVTPLNAVGIDQPEYRRTSRRPGNAGQFFRHAGAGYLRGSLRPEQHSSLRLEKSPPKRRQGSSVVPGPAVAQRAVPIAESELSSRDTEFVHPLGTTFHTMIR
jgi:hypothetical protein